MVSFSDVCRFITISAKVFVGIVLIANAFDILPKSATFTAFNLTEPRPLTGKLELNNMLDNAEKLFEYKIKGPEGLAVLDGILYTTLHGGFLGKVTRYEVTPVVRFGNSCRYMWEEAKCGRPLGLATTKDKYLIVADAYYGIYRVNPETGSFGMYVDGEAEIDGVKPKIFNDVTVGDDGAIYFTHSSSDFNLCDGLYTMLADPSGRLIRHNPNNSKDEVLLDKLHFANGIALSKDEDFILVAETGKGRITRFYLKGPKKSQSDIFIDGLPGLPDGIIPNGKGGFIVSLNVARDQNNLILLDYLAPMPLVRRTLARVLAFIEWLITQTYNFYPNRISLLLNHIVGHFEMLSPFYPRRATVIELLENGEINQTFHGFDGSVNGVSNVIVHKGYLYLGSPYTNYLARIPLSKLEGKFADTGERFK